jgi:hypothetical protein
MWDTADSNSRYHEFVMISDEVDVRCYRAWFLLSRCRFCA